MEAFKGLLGLAVVGVIIYAANSDDGVDSNTSTVAGLEQHTEDVIRDGEATSAVAYNEFAVGLQVRIMKSINAVDQNQDPEKVNHLLSTCKSEIKSSIAELRRIKPYRGGTEFRDALLENFQLMHRLIDIRYQVENGGNIIALMNEVSELEPTIHTSDTRVERAQMSFASLHNIMLENRNYGIDLPQ